MNREIKFRGKDKSAGRWWYGSYVYLPDSDSHHIIPCGSYKPSVNAFAVEQVEVDPSTLGQYTGLKDVNGVEIYEGDIIESVFMPIKPSENDQVILGVVEWWAERAEFIVNCTKLVDFDLKSLQSLSGYKYADGRFGMTFATKGKVVGNIHENIESSRRLSPRLTSALNPR